MPIVINDCVKCAPHGVRAVRVVLDRDRNNDATIFIKCDACSAMSGEYRDFWGALVEWNSDNPREPNW